MKKDLTITEISAFEKGAEQKRPLFIARVQAGFPSPADDFVENKLDLNEHLIKHPSATFFVKVEGESMREAGIYSGDTLIVDRALKASNNRVVIAAINGELTVKRIKKSGTKIYLMPENREFSPIDVTEDSSFEVWGVVTYVIHKL
ncbi:MAG: translesion error-prone DNA polymerase V autoproteolytic subunit [Pseudomonadota bacterium]